ncbi:MAG: energy-coupling factor ABC transporter permease [Clostridium sp.]|nr:energy-coupling factor ABC transporter permease [Clostridium sp.]MCM1171315.1 energy-coupling factor ABC transporter permease [Clostridium sp.]MCM1208795.1 energy-coupling factor ABC transporter permease [Ruminococcus sp.]
MHMADALINTGVAAVMYGLTAGTSAYSIHTIRKSEEPIKVPEMGIMGAFVFATQMINFAIPGTGSSGHICGGMLLSAMLGPSAGFVTMMGILIIQCLMFADGGIMALGANIWNMAFYGCFIGAGVIWRGILKNGASKKKITAASIIGCIVTLQLGAFSVTLETLISGVTTLPFRVFVSFMQPIHLAIGAVEGIITAAVLCFVYETKPDLLWGIKEDSKKERMSYGSVMAILGMAAIFIAGGLSLLASSLPDGLEWSVEKVTGDTELISEGQVYDTFSNIQDKVAVLPDYAFSGSDSAFGTSFSGIAGGIAVIGVCVLFCIVIKALRKRNGYHDEQV